MKKILVFGGSGFIGTNLLLKLAKNKNYDIHATFHQKKNFFRVKGVKYHKVDLLKSTNYLKISNLIKNSHSVFMLAAVSSGAKVIQNTPLALFQPNIKINLDIINLCYELSVRKFVFISSNTVYPLSDKKMKETDLNYSFFEKYFIVGWMKTFTEIICQIYSQKLSSSQLEILVVRPSNLFGPFDKYSLDKSKVIAALIRKFNDKRDSVEIWGDGSDIKDFLYIEDFCEALIHVYKKFSGFDVVNICSGKSVKLLSIIKFLSKYFSISNSKVNFNKKMPTMIPLRRMSNQKLFKNYNWKISSNLYDSLTKTIIWYQKNKKIYDNF